MSGAHPGCGKLTKVPSNHDRKAQWTLNATVSPNLTTYSSVIFFSRPRNCALPRAVPRYIASMDRKRPLQGDDAPARDGPSRQPTPITLTHRISPPIKKRRLPDQPISELSNEGTSLASNNHVFNSPFNLTKIKDLPNELNKDTVSLKDILGDPLISECWQFNFLHDVDFMMSAFDQDVRDLVKVHIVHGFWKSEGDRNHRKRDLEVSRSPFLCCIVT